MNESPFLKELYHQPRTAQEKDAIADSIIVILVEQVESIINRIEH